MTEFITVPIETDPDELSQIAFDYIETNFPGWQPNPGNLDTIFIEAVARIIAEGRDVASDVPLAIFRYYGASIAGIPPVDAAPATVTSTWTVIDTAGYTIPEGTLVGIPATGDELIPFAVQSDVIIGPSFSSTGVGEVVLVQVLDIDQGGSEANGLSSTPELIDILAFVSTITLVGSTSGGLDAESDTDYLNRLASELQLLTPRPILPRDFEVLAREVDGVGRALAIDGYNPGDMTYGNERMIALALVDDVGADVSAGVSTAVEDSLEAQREVNFVVNAIDPTRTAIAVVFTAVSYRDFDPAVVELAAEAAVADYLDPANWGKPKFGDQQLWIDTTKVRMSEIFTVINNTEGLDYVTSMTINAGTIDITMSGVAPMPTPGAISGTVTAP